MRRSAPRSSSTAMSMSRSPRRRPGSALSRRATALLEPRIRPAWPRSQTPCRTMRAAGRLGQVINRWIYTACLIFGLDLAGQRRTCFTYAYSVYQAEYSRNLLFAYGGHMDRVFNAMLDRTRSRLDIPALRTLFGARRRPGKYGTHPSPRVGVVLETPAW